MNENLQRKISAYYYKYVHFVTVVHNILIEILFIFSSYENITVRYRYDSMCCVTLNRSVIKSSIPLNYTYFN